MDFIRPGKPTENAKVERFNGSMRRELLDCHIFTSLSEVRKIVKEWMIDYNHRRPHEALDNLSPIQGIIITRFYQLKISSLLSVALSLRLP